MAPFKLLLRCLLWGVGVVLVLAHIATFTVWQSYISGKTGALDYVVPAVVLILAGVVTYCFVRAQSKTFVWLWTGLVAIFTAVNGVLYQYYHSMHVPMSSYDIEPLLQLTWAELLSTQVTFFFNSNGAVIALAIIAVVLVATGLLKTRHVSAVCSVGCSAKALRWCILLCLVGCVMSVVALPTVQKVVSISSDWSQSIAKAMSQIQASKAPVAHKQEQGELYVLVIGESQNRDFMGLYNDLFETNPRLKATLQPEQSVIFTNAYSCLTDTLPVLAHALSNQVVEQSQTTDLGKIVGSDFVSLGAVLKAAQVHSVYLSNQNLSGLFGSDLTWLTKDFDESQFLNDSQWNQSQLDEALIPAFSQVLSSLDPKANNVVVLHLKGNQAPFAVRYPVSYAHYQPEQWNEGLVGSVVPDESAALSSYLNATAYNDYVLAEILAVAKQHPSFMGMLYFSDHSVALDDGHNYAAFDYDMTRVPLLFTCSERYAQRYGTKLTVLRNNKNTFLSNDRIYDLFLDLMAVDSSAYQPEFSPANDHFEPLTDAVLPEGVNLMFDPAYQVQQQWPKLPQALKSKLALHRSGSL
ncbi:MAG: phosphoethanolamine transferase [Anaerobiospirillum sp.]|nr:phosphoethanolamine transferase [Anaerobiospirillum sp.]